MLEAICATVQRNVTKAYYRVQPLQSTCPVNPNPRTTSSQPTLSVPRIPLLQDGDVPVRVHAGLGRGVPPVCGPEGLCAGHRAGPGDQGGHQPGGGRAVWPADHAGVHPGALPHRPADGRGALRRRPAGRGAVPPLPVPLVGAPQRPAGHQRALRPAGAALAEAPHRGVHGRVGGGGRGAERGLPGGGLPAGGVRGRHHFGGGRVPAVLGQLGPHGDRPRAVSGGGAGAVEDHGCWGVPLRVG